MASYAYESITVSSTPIGFTAARLTDATKLYGRDVKQVFVTVETNPVRFTVDGVTTPTADIGHLLSVGNIFTCDGNDAIKFLAIRTGSDGALKCTYSV
jgi:hypothetical protein